MHMLKVNQLEDELEDARAGAAAQQQPPPPPSKGDAELAGLRQENATLQRRLTAVQAQVRRCWESLPVHARGR